MRVHGEQLVWKFHMLTRWKLGPQDVEARKGFNHRRGKTELGAVKEERGNHRS